MIEIDTRMRSLVARLASQPTSAILRNPYRCTAAIRNLEHYLTVAAERDPSWLFVGEAPGYRGAAVSGVPFTSLDVLLAPRADPWAVFGPRSQFRACPEAPYRRESTATMFWDVVARASPRSLPITWNALPFHPTTAEGGNRPPARDELELGLLFLQEVLGLFQSLRVIAVGQAASYSLTRLGVAHSRVRHPSRGGKAEFERGLLDHRWG